MRKALFASLNTPTSVAIARRIGYVHTQHQYLMVRWFVTLPEHEQRAMIDEVAARGPF